MKIYVRADMEGDTKVTNYEQVTPGSADYTFGQKMLMSDLNAAVAGAFDGGAKEVLIYDMHAEGKNVIPEELDKRATLISGKPLPTENYNCGLDSSFDAMFLVGFHSKALTKDALLAHTYELETSDIVVNGRSIGEIGVEAGIAGEMDVPLTFFSGDSEAVREARDLVGEDLHAACVKESQGEFKADCFPPEKTTQIIRKAAQESLKCLNPDQCLSFGSPVSLCIRFRKEDIVNKLKPSDRVKILDPFSLCLEGPSLMTVWREYLHLRHGNRRGF